MNKAEIASYMASLLTLLEHQDKSGVHLRSQELGDEFERCWGELKELIDKEKENARESKQQHVRPKDPTQDQRSESGRGSPDRRGPDEPTGGPAAQGPGSFGPTNVLYDPSRR